MDLQWQRQAELWLKLMDAAKQPISRLIFVSKGRDTFYLEQHGGRARLSVGRQIPELQRYSLLLSLLRLLQPEACNGVPLRTWLSGGCLWLSAMAPLYSGAEFWAEISRRQSMLLDRIMDNRYENAQ